MELIQNYELPMSLWSMIMDNVALNELDEVKSFIGRDLVDQSVELRSEITTLLEIYKTFSFEQASGDSIKQFLPEPPEVRERLIKEIKFFVTGIREQARSQGKNPDKALENHHNDIIDYAYESSSNSSRPTTSSGSFISTSRSSYRATPISDRINVNLLKEKLNYMEFEEVQSNLKQFLQEEVNQLNTDLIEIQNALYHDDVERCFSSMSRHTISELKQERHELEQILLQSSRPLSNTSSKNSQTSVRTSRKSIGETTPNSNHTIVPANSSPKLKPICNKVTNKSAGYVKSPLEIELPEKADPSPDDATNTNNSSVTSRDLDTFNSTKSLPQKSCLEKPMRFNSAQRFRQKVLQNRKDTLPNRYEFQFH